MPLEAGESSRKFGARRGLAFRSLYIPASSERKPDKPNTQSQPNITASRETQAMLKLINALRRDEAGFIVSAELILISTIAVLSLVVGLSELSNNVNQELEDVGSAIGAVNQSYCYTLASGHKGSMAGSHFNDKVDECDGQFDLTCNTAPQSESRHNNW